MLPKLKTYWQLQFTRQAIGQNIFRLFFLGLLIFELLNIFQLLHDTLDFTWRGLFITALFALIVLEGIAYFYFLRKNYLLHWLIWLLLAIALSLDASADMFHLYGRFDWWDELIHCFNSAAICFGIFVVVSAFWLDQFRFKLLSRHERRHLALYIAAVTTMTLSALYEIEEYSEDLLYKTHRLGLGTDTADDLLFNALGVLFMIVVLSILLAWHRRKKDKLLS